MQNNDSCLVIIFSGVTYMLRVKLSCLHQEDIVVILHSLINSTQCSQKMKSHTTGH